MPEMQTASSTMPPPDPRIATLAREVQSLENALQKGRWVRLGLTLMLIVFTLVTTWRFVALANQLQSEENLKALMAAGQERFASQLPLIRQQLQLLVDESSPVVTQAFYAQAKEDLPEFMAALRAERDPLVDNLKTQLAERIDKAYEKALHDKQQLIRENVPEADNPEVLAKMEEQFNKAFARMVEKYYIAQLEDQTSDMFRLWDDFPAEQRDPSDPPLPDVLIGHLLEIASTKMASSDVKPAMIRQVPNEDTVETESQPEPAEKAPETSSSESKTAERVADATAEAKSEPVPPEPAAEAAAAK